MLYRPPVRFVFLWFAHMSQILDPRTNSTENGSDQITFSITFYITLYSEKSLYEYNSVKQSGDVGYLMVGHAPP